MPACRQAGKKIMTTPENASSKPTTGIIFGNGASRQPSFPGVGKEWVFNPETQNYEEREDSQNGVHPRTENGGEIK